MKVSALELELHKAVETSKVVGTKVTSLIRYKAIHDALKVWELPVVGTVYEGTNRSHPKENSKQITNSVEVYFGVIVAVPTIETHAGIPEQSHDELDDIRGHIASRRLPNGRRFIFLSEQVLEVTNKVTIYVQRWSIASNIPLNLNKS